MEGWQSHGWKVKNADAKIKSKGIEIASDFKINKNINIDFNYNFSDTYDGADCDDPNVGATSCIDESMVRVPKHSWSSTITHKKNKFINKLSLSYSDEVRDYGNGNNNFKDVILDEYFVVDYNLNYEIFDNLNFYFNIDNIFNESYEQAFMYSSMERSLNFGLSREF